MSLPEYPTNHLISSQGWSDEQIEKVLEDAKRFRAGQAPGWARDCLRNRSVFLLYNSRSTRTRLSFHAAAVELGAVPLSVDLDREPHSNEAWRELGKALIECGVAIGVRLLPDDAGLAHGSCEKLLLELAALSDEANGPPVISLSHDRCHPCQGLYELLTYREALNHGGIRKRKILYTWVRGKRAAPRSPTQDSLMMMTRMGMDVTLCHPDGDFGIDDEVRKICEQNAGDSGGSFKRTHDFEDACRGQEPEVVYARHWGPPATEGDAAKWYADEAHVRKAWFVHPMPIERDVEAASAVVDGPRSLLSRLIINKNAIQKSVLAHLVGMRKRAG